MGGADSGMGWGKRNVAKWGQLPNLEQTCHASKTIHHGGLNTETGAWLNANFHSAPLSVQLGFHVKIFTHVHIYMAFAGPKKRSITMQPLSLEIPPDKI